MLPIYPHSLNAMLCAAALGRARDEAKKKKQGRAGLARRAVEAEAAHFHCIFSCVL